MNVRNVSACIRNNRSVSPAKCVANPCFKNLSTSSTRVQIPLSPPFFVPGFLDEDEKIYIGMHPLCCKAVLQIQKMPGGGEGHASPAVSGAGEQKAIKSPVRTVAWMQQGKMETASGAVPGSGLPRMGQDAPDISRSDLTGPQHDMRQQPEAGAAACLRKAKDFLFHLLDFLFLVWYSKGNFSYWR